MEIIVALIIFLIMLFLLYLAGILAFVEAECRVGAICTGILGLIMLFVIIFAGSSKLINKCPSCGAAITTQMTFCRDCGSYLHADKYWFCDNCKKEISLDQNFCTECGSSKKEWIGQHTDLYSPQNEEQLQPTRISKGSQISFRF